MVVGEFGKEVDVLVIGAGPGGYVAAIRAAQLGKKVTIVERGSMGGVCLNVGCIPSKALISAAERYEMMSEDQGMGIVAENVQLDFEQVQTWKKGIVSRLTGGVEALLKGNKVEIVEGEALFVSENEVRVNRGYESERLQFNHCIIATGSRPTELSAFPFGGRIISSTEALELTEVPKSMVVIGGGYIGVELGQMFSKFGTEVTILEAEKQILPSFERQLAQLVQRNMKKSGANVIRNAYAQSVRQDEDSVTVTYTVKDKEETVTADYLLITVGRTPNTEELGLDLAGIKVNETGLIDVDEQCRTSNQRVFAIGDVVAGPALAHKASYEAKVAAEVIAGQASAVDYKVIPSVVFSDPEIAVVGLTEEEAKEAGYEVTEGKFPYAANGRALSINNTDGFVKVVANKENGVILGAQVVGSEASNLIAELGLAIEMGATLEDVALTIHAHPTLGEMAMEAAEAALGLPVHMMKQ